jgi:hypothetical protein
VLLADDAHFFAVRIVGEGLDHIRAGVNELTVELSHNLRMLEYNLRYECSSLQVASPLALEEITLGADDGALGEPL